MFRECFQLRMDYLFFVCGLVCLPLAVVMDFRNGNSLTGVLCLTGILAFACQRRVKDAMTRARTAELRRAIEEVRQLALAAEATTKAKSDFLAMMSHEIRNPLHSVIGTTELFFDTPLDYEQRHYAEIIRSSGEMLLAVVNDILDFSKIEAGKLKLEMTCFDLRKVVEDVADMLAVKAHEKGLGLTCLLEPACPRLLKGDSIRLRQILINLVGNAVKFTSTGEVAIRVACEAETRGPATLRFTIADTGVGIAKERVDNLFSLYGQADYATARTYGGTGLGLTIAKQLVEMMGGGIGLESKMGSGSVFWFTAVFERQPDGGAGSGSGTTLRGLKILVVDDHAATRQMLAAHFRFWGCRHDEAADGVRALEMLQKAAHDGDSYRVVLINATIAEMSGEILAARLKAEPVLRRIPLFMLTPLGRRIDMARLERFGVAAVIFKPVRVSRLQDELMRALNLQESPTQNASSPVDAHARCGEVVVPEKGRVLVVDDNISNQLMTAGILGKLGYKADVAGSGVEALKLLHDTPCDVVLMDCQMPEMDGFETARRIRELQSKMLDPDIPIIAMTAYAMKGDREKCLSGGMDGYIAKPFQPKELDAILSRWIARRKAGSATASSAGEAGKPLAQANEIFSEERFMKRLMVDKKLGRVVIAGFLSDIPDQLRCLKELVVTGDVLGIKRQAHKIKGAAAVVGADFLQEAAVAMCQQGEAGDLEAAAAMLPRFETEFERFKGDVTQRGWTR